MLRIVLSGMLLIMGLPIFAQSPGTIKKSAEKAYTNTNWEKAYELYIQYQNTKPGETEVLSRIGICAYHLHKSERAKEFLQYVCTRMRGSATPDAFYFLARTYHGLADFQLAADAYKQFLRVADGKHPWRANARDNILRCLSGQNASENNEVALVENLGKTINSKGDEFAPLPSKNHPNRLYYSAARSGTRGGKRNEQGLEDDEAGKWCSDIFSADRVPSGWEDRGGLSPFINSPRYEVAMDFGENGEILYYFRGFTLYSGDLVADTATVNDEYALQPPSFKSPVDPTQSDTDLFFFNDSTILFASRREGGYGGLDIYMSKLSEGLWSEPLNLGPNVNSAYDECSPFLAKDGRTLYLSSNRTESIGGLDVFITHFADASASWNTPEPFGTPVNSPGNDSHFRISRDGTKAYFSSDRLESYGQRDIYLAYFKNPQAAALRTSSPRLFDEVVPPETENKTVVIPALYYTSDADVLSDENLESIRTAVQTALTVPGSKIMINAHTASSGQAKFDLYYGIRRAAMVADKMKEFRFPASRILLKSAGGGFPASKTVIGANPYPAGAQLNNRIEISLHGEADARMQRRNVPDAARSKKAGEFDNWMKGLCYKVEMVRASQLVTADALSMFPSLMIDSRANDAEFRYSAGFFKEYNEAVKLQEDLKRAGFKNASIIAFVDGVPLSKAEAVALLKKYPGLADFIKG